jgi:putative tricarboxylic transport membrane protein
MTTSILGCLLTVAALSVIPAHAQGFKPSRTVEIVVHSGLGTGNDILGRAIRAIAEKENLLPVRMNVVNKTGGAGATAMAYMAERKADTHVIGLYTAAWLTAPMMSKEIRVQFQELTPIANLLVEPSVIVVKGDSPYKTLTDFIDAAKKNPDKLLQVGSSIESRANLLRLVLQRQTGARWGHVPFPGAGERIAAVLGGHAHIYFGDPPEVLEHVNSGALRVVAQIADKRLPAFPNAPTIQEAGYSLPSILSVRGVIAPPGVAKDVAEYWENLFDRMVKTEAWRKFVQENHLEEHYLTSREIGKVADEIVAERRQLYAEFGIKTAR